MGLEPTTTVLKTVILPLNYSPYKKNDLTKAKSHLKKSKNLFNSVVGSYNLYLTILGNRNEAKNAIKNHQRYEKLNVNL